MLYLVALWLDFAGPANLVRYQTFRAGAVLMTVDPLLVLFWTAAMVAGWRAVQAQTDVRPWLWVGLWMGLGFLSKYTALFQFVCWGLFFVLSPDSAPSVRCRRQAMRLP